MRTTSSLRLGTSTSDSKPLVCYSIECSFDLGDAERQPDHDTVHAFYEAATKAGGKPNGEPGDRAQYGANYYAAFVLDPVGYASNLFTYLDASACGSSCTNTNMPPGSDSTKRRRARTGCLKCRIRRRKCWTHWRFGRRTTS